MDATQLEQREYLINRFPGFVTMRLNVSKDKKLFGNECFRLRANLLFSKDILPVWMYEFEWGLSTVKLELELQDCVAPLESRQKFAEKIGLQEVNREVLTNEGSSRLVSGKQSLTASSKAMSLSVDKIVKSSSDNRSHQKLEYNKNISDVVPAGEDERPTWVFNAKFHEGMDTLKGGFSDYLSDIVRIGKSPMIVARLKAAPLKSSGVESIRIDETNSLVAKLAINKIKLLKQCVKLRIWEEIEPYLSEQRIHIGNS